MKMNSSKRATRSQTSILLRGKFGNLIHSDPSFHSPEEEEHHSPVIQSSSITTNPSYHHDETPTSPPYDTMSPFHPSPYAKSPWITSSTFTHLPETGLIASLIREEGHIYSLAASGGLLYTGSDSKNIRVWKSQEEFSGFKSGSGLVKAIVISGERIFTGHQDGKIRIWKVSSKDSSVHKRVGTLPRVRDMIKSSVKPGNYVEVRRHRNALWIKHFDVISCLSVNEEQGLLYSGSWDKTLKVWRISTSKCLESISAHDDAINSVVSGFDGLVFTGSADGTVKAWRLEIKGNRTKRTKHLHAHTLLNQDSAVTALVIDASSSVIYSGSSDGVVNFWVRSKGAHPEHGGALTGHKQAVLCLAARGNLVFSGSADKTICVWRRELNEHTCLSVLTGHGGPIKCLAVERDDEESTAENPGWILYSGSLDKAVKVWKVSERGSGLDKMDAVLENQEPTSFSYPNY